VSPYFFFIATVGKISQVRIDDARLSFFPPLFLLPRSKKVAGDSRFLRCFHLVFVKRGRYLGSTLHFSSNHREFLSSPLIDS